MEYEVSVNISGRVRVKGAESEQDAMDKVEEFAPWNLEIDHCMPVEATEVDG